MNLRKNQQRKDLVIKMIKEIAELQSQVPKYAAQKLNYLLKSFLHDSLDFEKGIIFINNNMKESKELPMKMFWIKVVQIVRKYFDESNKLNKQN
jgi:hypothetical protein